MIHHNCPYSKNAEDRGQMQCKPARAERTQYLMKKTFIFFLCCSTLLYSCAPLIPLTKEDWLAQSSLPEKEIFITLVDGSVITAQPHHYFYTTEPGDFIVGFGMQKHRFIRGEHTHYTGKVQRASIDSLAFIGGGNNKYLICYLPDSTDIYYGAGDYIMVTPDQSPGLWCTGTLTADGKNSIFSGKIPQERIKHIEMRRFSLWQTSLLVGSVIIIGGIIFVATTLRFDKFNLKGSS
jgi:hypothetical protein